MKTSDFFSSPSVKILLHLIDESKIFTLSSISFVQSSSGEDYAIFRDLTNNKALIVASSYHPNFDSIYVSHYYHSHLSDSEFSQGEDPTMHGWNNLSQDTEKINSFKSYCGL